MPYRLPYGMCNDQRSVTRKGKTMKTKEVKRVRGLVVAELLEALVNGDREAYELVRDLVGTVRLTDLTDELVGKLCRVCAHHG